MKFKPKFKPNDRVIYVDHAGGLYSAVGHVVNVLLEDQPSAALEVRLDSGRVVIRDARKWLKWPIQWKALLQRLDRLASEAEPGRKFDAANSLIAALYAAGFRNLADELEIPS